MAATAAEAPEVTIEFELVTPKKAKEYLALLPERQRTKRFRTRAKYVRDMVNGHWYLAGAPIEFDTNGELINGMHRLEACVEANASFPAWVARNVDPKAMTVIDTGLGRSFADTLQVTRGTLYRNEVGAIVRRVWQWERGNFVGRSPGKDTDNPKWEAPTHSDMMDRLDKEEDVFLAAAQRGKDASMRKLGSASAGGTAFFLFTKIDHQQGHTFFDLFIGGTNLTDGHPAWTLRERLRKRGVRGIRERLLVQEQLALYIRAWNAFREDRTVDRLQVTTSNKGLTNDNFPKPI